MFFRLIICCSFPCVTNFVHLGLLYVAHLKGDAFGLYDAVVGHLAAQLGVERGPVQHDGAFYPLAQLAGELAHYHEGMVFFSGFAGFNDSFGPVQIATILCLWGLVIGAVYMLRAYRNIFQGDLSKAAAYATELLPSERAANYFLISSVTIHSFCMSSKSKQEASNGTTNHQSHKSVPLFNPDNRVRRVQHGLP